MVVLEGVLATIEPITVERKLRSDKIVGYNINWVDLPMRRLATMQRQFPDVGAEIVTFHSQAMADVASDFLERADVSFDSLTYAPFETWVSLLPFQQNLQAVFDSDQSRLERYGQIGRSVTFGGDFT